MVWRLLLSCLLLAPGLAAAGCGNAIATGHTATLTGYDLEAMAAQMAQSIMADPDVQRAIAEEGPLRVVVLPVENQMTGEVLPLGQARAFTAQVRVLLARAQTGGFLWINNRDTYYSLRDAQLETWDLGPSPEAVSPNYALHATFRSLTQDDRRRRSAFYQAVFSLTDIDNRTTLWTDVYNVKRTAVRGFLD